MFRLTEIDALNHYWQVENWKRKATETCSTSNHLLAAGQWITGSNFITEHIRRGQTRKKSIYHKLKNQVVFNQDNMGTNSPLTVHGNIPSSHRGLRCFITLTSIVV